MGQLQGGEECDGVHAHVGQIGKSLPPHTYPFSALPLSYSVVQACEEHPFLKQLCHAKGVTARHVFTAAKRALPKLTIKRMVVRKPLTKANQDARVKAAKRLLKLTDADLRRAVWVDEASIYLSPEAQTAIGVMGVELSRLDPRPTTSLWGTGVLRFILAVNAEIGLVACMQLSHSAGYNGESFFVSLGVWGGACQKLH